MEYVSTSLPSAPSVKGIFTVLAPDLSRLDIGRGEAHAFPEIFFLDRGDHTLVVDGAELNVKSGQMVIYAPGSHHSSTGPSNSTASIISFDVAGDSLSLIYNRVLTLTAEQQKTFRDIFGIAITCFERRKPNDTVGGMVLREGVDAYTLQKIRLKLEILLTDLVGSANDSMASSPKGIRWEREYAEALDFMRKSINLPLNLSDIAEGCSMSVSKLKLLFREKYGGGPITCFIDLKIDEAKRLIREEKMNFSEIATSLGFASLHYFSRLFKDRAGLSPSEYAKKSGKTD